jgi:GYF domain 2/Domain of unknown function (DUF4234)
LERRDRIFAAVTTDAGTAAMHPEEPRLWWYALDGVQHGPVSEADLLDMRRRGQINPRSLVWTEGMREWASFSRTALHEQVPAGDDSEDAFVIEDPWFHIIISVITCGIWGYIIFYRLGKAYATHSGQKDNFDAWFWSYVGASVASIATGLLMLPAAIAIGALLLKETLDHRRTLERRAEISPPLTDTQTHLVLWVIGSVLGAFIVGIPIMIYQTVLFFRDHNRLCEARA